MFIMNEIVYENNRKEAIFEGLKYYLRESQGYYYRYAAKGENSILHRAVWIKHNGMPEKGTHIHHKDEDKSNNEIENLICITPKTHMMEHAKTYTSERRQQIKDNLTNNARPKASEWHGSKEGSQWHKEHYEKYKDLLHQRELYICIVCGKEYESQKCSRHKCCSNKCHAKSRRLSGLDDETRECVVCGGKFICNRFYKTKTCGLKCGIECKRQDGVKTGRISNRIDSDMVFALICEVDIYSLPPLVKLVSAPLMKKQLKTTMYQIRAALNELKSNGLIVSGCKSIYDEKSEKYNIIRGYGVTNKGKQSDIYKKIKSLNTILLNINP